MDESKFSFVTDSVLRENLNNSYKFIEHLLFLLTYKKLESWEPSYYRKTAIIETASIIEALLAYTLKETVSEDGSIVGEEEWVTCGKPIWAGDLKEGKRVELRRVKKERKRTPIEKLNLDWIRKELWKRKMIHESLREEIEKVRNLRNQQHLLGMDMVKVYSDEEMRETFKTAGNVFKFALTQTKSRENGHVSS